MLMSILMRLHLPDIGVGMSSTPRKNSLLTKTHVVAWARMARATNTILQSVETALKRHGLPSLSWYDLLLELYRARPEGLRPVRLQEGMLMPQSNMSRLLDRVEAAGYIQRSACDDDGRGQLVGITDAGEDLLRHMWPVYRKALVEMFAMRIGAKSAADLANALQPFSVKGRPRVGDAASYDDIAANDAGDT